MKIDIIMEITIFWVRHGFSCANLYKNEHVNQPTIITKHIVKPIDIVGESITHDALLTNKTIHDMCSSRTHYKLLIEEEKVDMILCSELARAVETAMFLFKSSNPLDIYVVPYVSEIRNKTGIDFSNDPSKLDKLKNHTASLYSKQQDYCSEENQHMGLPNISFRIIDEFRRTTDGYIDTSPDLHKFIKLVIKFMIDHKIIINKPSIKIAIVSHGHFISKMTGVPIVSNLDVVRQHILVDSDLITITPAKGQKIYNHKMITIDDVNNDGQRCGTMVIQKVISLERLKKLKKDIYE